MKEKIKGVILDWAGVTVDFGCFAQTTVLIEVFKKQGIDITAKEAREDMGLGKKEHIKAILKLKRIENLWKKKHGRKFTDKDIDKLHDEFDSEFMRIIPNYTYLIDGVLEVIKVLKKNKIKIGSTSGYTMDVLEMVVKDAKIKGYSPDFVAAVDDSGHGCPYPYMIFKNIQELELSSVKSIIKLSSTAAGIKEGVNAGVISVGVIAGSNEMGLTYSEYKALPKEKKKEASDKIKNTFKKAGANYLIKDITKLPALIGKINKAK